MGDYVKKEADKRRKLLHINKINKINKITAKL